MLEREPLPQNILDFLTELRELENKYRLFIDIQNGDFASSSAYLCLNDYALENGTESTHHIIEKTSRESYYLRPTRVRDLFPIIEYSEETRKWVK